MIASTQARERLISDNAKKQAKINELQAFVKRFSANASKAKQATSRRKLIDKLQAGAVQVKPSSRQNPYIRFEQKKQLYRQAFNVQSISKSFKGMFEPVFIISFWVIVSGMSAPTFFSLARTYCSCLSNF